MPHKSNRHSQQPAGSRSRWLWFVGLWLAGTVALLVFAYLLRGIMSAVGMTT
ncbi:hypothetical protein W822_00205 [Advenella kashmirensis W13003]|uniref:Cyanide insensitive terminal oxidase, subunit III n=1 Tax=Advenella kashmirensis W13003 TaxID=1424334 RepID=V8QXD8_9BURK|nr:hypothetical protein W822_00205 [Advenella kashmirensis W13003]